MKQSEEYAPLESPHRVVDFPRQARKSWPAHWVKVFGWRQIVAYTPKVGTHAAFVTLRVLPRFGGWIVGVHVWKDEDDEWVIRVGVGVVEVEINTVEFWR